MGKASDASNSMSSQLEQVRDKLSESGETVAATAVHMKDKATDVVKTAVKDAAEALPSNQQELEAAMRSLMDSIRRNPKPWVIGATVAGIIWLLGRGSKR